MSLLLGKALPAATATPKPRRKPRKNMPHPPHVPSLPPSRRTATAIIFGAASLSSLPDTVAARQLQREQTRCPPYPSPDGPSVAGYATWTALASDLSYAALVADNYPNASGGTYVICPGATLTPDGPLTISAQDTVVKCGTDGDGGDAEGGGSCVIRAPADVSSFYILQSNWAVTGVRFEGVTFSSAGGGAGEPPGAVPTVLVGLPPVFYGDDGDADGDDPQVSFVDCRWKSLACSSAVLVTGRLDNNKGAIINATRAYNNPDGSGAAVSFERCRFVGNDFERGAVHVSAGVTNITGSTFDSNSVRSDALIVASEGANLSMEGSCLQRNVVAGPGLVRLPPLYYNTDAVAHNFERTNTVEGGEGGGGEDGGVCMGVYAGRSGVGEEQDDDSDALAICDIFSALSCDLNFKMYVKSGAGVPSSVAAAMATTAMAAASYLLLL